MHKTTAFVLPIGLTLGGSNTWSVRMAGHLVETDASPALIEHTCVDWHPPWKMSLPVGIRHIRCPGPVATEAGGRDIRSFADTYMRVLPAVFVPNFTEAAYAACAMLTLRHASQVRVVGVAHGDSEAYYHVLRYYEPIIHRFIAVNPDMAEKMKPMLPGREKDIVVRSCPVDVPGEFECRTNSQNNPLIIVYAGRVTNHEKRASRLIPLAQELDRRGIDFRMRIIGEGGYGPTLESEVKALPPGLQQRIFIDGMLELSEMPEVWRNADVSILVSDTESAGLSLLEAMVYGCVPVATRCGGPETFIENGVDGLLSETGDIAGMAENIASLAMDAAKRQAMARAAYRKVSELYSYQHYVPWFLDIVKEEWKDAPRGWPRKRPILPRHGFAVRLRSRLSRIFS